jgi:DNA-binding beta-propeller fold protein YncE
MGWPRARIVLVSLATLVQIASPAHASISFRQAPDPALRMASDWPSNQEVWQNVYSLGDFASALAVSPDGRVVYATGTCFPSVDCPHEDMLTAAFDANTGQVLWDAVEDGPGGHARLGGAGLDIAISPEGGKVFVTGDFRGRPIQNSTDYGTVAYDASTGTRLWSVYYNADNETDIAWKVAVSPDGGSVFVTGQSWANGTEFDYATIRYDADTGSQLWLKRYNGPGMGHDIPHALAVSPDGSLVYVTGESPGVYYSDYGTVAYDAATGRRVWQARFNDPAKPGDIPYGLSVSPDGSTIFVTGCAGIIDECVDGDVVTIAYDGLTGRQKWQTRYDGPAQDIDVGEAIATGPDGSLVYVTAAVGAQQGVRSNAKTIRTEQTFDYVTIAYDSASGRQAWLSVFDGPGGRFDVPCCLRVSEDGSTVIVTGTSSVEYQSSFYATLAYDAYVGTERWTASFMNHPAYNIPASLGISPDSSIAFVAGTTAGQGYEWGLVAYQAGL